MPTTKVSVTKEKLDDLANVISDKSGETVPMTIDEMIEAVDRMSTGGTYQTKTVIPTTAQQNVTPDTGYDALSQVTVSPIPSEYIIPSGSVNITSNGTTDVTNFATANVNVAPLSAECNDVNFIDYDGTIVYSYSKSEFLALTSLPPNPSHSGLIAQGWNWDLADAKAFVTKYGIAEIGQSYTTSDGKTRFYIYTNLPEEKATFAYKQQVANAVTIDWGDGTSSGPSSTTNSVVEYEHSYSVPGKYVASVSCSSGTWYTGIGLNTYYPMFAVRSQNGAQHYSALEKIELGDAYSLSNDALPHIAYNAYGLNSITIPNSSGNKYFLQECFYSAHNLKCIVFPKGTVSLGQDALYDGSMKTISLPNENIAIGSASNSPRLGLTLSLRRFLFPDGSVPAYGNNIWQATQCVNLREIVIPDNSTITSIMDYGFQKNSRLEKITIPAGITDIGAYAFYQCSYLCEIHVKATTPPTIKNTTLSGVYTYCKIYVPYSSDHSILNAYKNASFWSSRSSYIFEET